jgi:hypothetical protein
VVLADGLIRSVATWGGATVRQGATTPGGSDDGGMSSDAERIELYRHGV